MKITIASGKGGVGKTTLAAVLAITASRQGRATAYVDCDVEAPNGHLLLSPNMQCTIPVMRQLPQVNLDRCNRCGACEQTCQFGAIVCLGITVQVNANLCKSCGACIDQCPQDAIHETDFPIGIVETGSVELLQFIQGKLNIGVARSIPVIQAAQKAVNPNNQLVIFDAPPGTACPMVTTVRKSDAVILVTDATPFGLADLALAVNTVRQLHIPIGVVINRSDLGDDRVMDYCHQQALPILAQIPYSNALAHAYANGDFQQIIDAVGTTANEILEGVSKMPSRCCA
jgi:MinD superfamily P-loop ATPase